MKFARLIALIGCCALLTASWAGAKSLASPVGSRDEANVALASGSWYFAVSGDSRDCGDVIMPRIAQSIADNKKKPAAFYWHLGDLRAIWRVDCDMAKRSDPHTKCALEAAPGEKVLVRDDAYVKRAWQDFRDYQVKPFKTDFVLGIGNHELISPKTREMFRHDFKDLLTKSPEGSTYFHFVKNGVDFINLDNANLYNEDPQDKPKKDPGFSADQLTWLENILIADKADQSIKAVVVGMHAALPESRSQRHAMDRTCESYCSGKRAYAMIERFQSGGKQVLVLASHSHYHVANAYDTPEHNMHGLPGWIIGTAGAEQYTPTPIEYGYLLVEVRPNGTLVPSFKRVTPESASIALAKDEPLELIKYCFERNAAPPNASETFVTAKDCTCKN